MSGMFFGTQYIDYRCNLHLHWIIRDRRQCKYSHIITDKPVAVTHQ